MYKMAYIYFTITINSPLRQVSIIPILQMEKLRLGEAERGYPIAP